MDEVAGASFLQKVRATPEGAGIAGPVTPPEAQRIAQRTHPIGGIMRRGV